MEPAETGGKREQRRAGLAEVTCSRAEWWEDASVQSGLLARSIGEESS